jgi:hypothetical protein
MRHLLRVVLVLSLGGLWLQAGEAKKKLIEFGWDAPDTAFLRQHIAEMEQMPFDGCVFHVNCRKADGTRGRFSWECWGRREFSREDLGAAFEDLKATPCRRFTHNFLRFNVTPGNVDWFDDFSPILNNARLAGDLAREGKCSGILFDIEQYKTHLFNYHTQRDAGTKTWELYAAQARRRGREVMSAFASDFPTVQILLTYGYSLPWAQSRSGKKSLADGNYGLLAPFLDGMVEAAKQPGQIIDGYERAYAFRDTALFAKNYTMMKQELLPIVAEPDRYHRAVSLGFGLWLDYNSSKLGWNPDQPEKNYYTPEGFAASARKALEVADEYVWVYSQTPRWWSRDGKPAQLPAAYIEALRQARAAVR